MDGWGRGPRGSWRGWPTRGPRLLGPAHRTLRLPRRGGGDQYACRVKSILARGDRAGSPRSPLRPEVLFDGREVGVEVAQTGGQVFVDEIQIQVPIQVHDPVPEPRHPAHRLRDGGRDDAILLEQ